MTHEEHTTGDRDERVFLQRGALVARRYEVEAPLGGGAMGAVYAARHSLTGARVALKILHLEGTRSATHVERFRREAAIAAEVAHEGLVRVLDAGLDEESGRLWLAMELLEGETLGGKMERGDTTLVALLGWARAVLAPLQAAHDAGFVHRDLKPENVFVCDDGAVKLLDLGIARPIGQKTATQTGTTVGTPVYMSPEQALRPSTVDGRADVWSFGALLYEMLTGAPPFDGESAHAVVIAASTEPHAPLDRALVPGALVEIVDRCLAKDPAGRPRAAEVASALDAVLAGRALESVARARLRPGALDATGAGSRSGSIVLPLRKRPAPNSTVREIVPPVRRRTGAALLTIAAACGLGVAAFAITRSPAPTSAVPVVAPTAPAVEEIEVVISRPPEARAARPDEPEVEPAIQPTPARVTRARARADSDARPIARERGLVVEAFGAEPTRTRPVDAPLGALPELASNPSESGSPTTTLPSPDSAPTALVAPAVPPSTTPPTPTATLRPDAGSRASRPAARATGRAEPSAPPFSF